MGTTRAKVPSACVDSTFILAAAVQELAENDCTTEHSLQTETTLRGMAESTPDDLYAPVDALLHREPGGRAAHQADHRSPAWRRQEAGSILRSWQNDIDDHCAAILSTASLQVPIVELRTGKAVQSGHLAGLLGYQNIAYAIMMQ